MLNVFLGEQVWTIVETGHKLAAVKTADSYGVLSSACVFAV